MKPNRYQVDVDAGRGKTVTVGVDTPALLAVIEDVRAALQRPDNDFSWSSFGDMDAAISELDGIATRIRSGDPVPAMLRVLFAPTGPIEEAALSSGWGDEYLARAKRFDAALAGEVTQ